MTTASDHPWLINYAAVALQCGVPILQALDVAYHDAVNQMVQHYRSVRGDFPWATCQNPDVLMPILRISGETLRHMIYHTPQMCELAVAQCPAVLGCVPESLRTREMFATALPTCGWLLKLMPVEWITAKLCYSAVQSYSEALNYVPEHLRTLDMYRAAVTAQWDALRYVPPHIQAQHPQLVTIALRKCCHALMYVHHQTHQMCAEVVTQHPLAIRHVTDQTPELCLAAVQANPEALKYVKEPTAAMLAAACK